MVMDRSSNVAGSRPMSAMALGHQTEQAFGCCRSPTQRRTNALVRYSPALRMPRNSALEDRVRLVDEQCRPVVIDGSGQSGSSDIGHVQGPSHQATEDLK